MADGMQFDFDEPATDSDVKRDDAMLAALRGLHIISMDPQVANVAVLSLGDNFTAQDLEAAQDVLRRLHEATGAFVAVIPGHWDMTFAYCEPMETK